MAATDFEEDFFREDMTEDFTDLDEAFNKELEEEALLLTDDPYTTPENLSDALSRLDGSSFVLAIPLGGEPNE